MRERRPRYDPEAPEREREVLGLLAQHYNAPYIAKKLVLSTSTVKTLMRNLYAKLEVHSQSDLYLFLESTAKISSQEESHDRPQNFRRSRFRP